MIVAIGDSTALLPLCEEVSADHLLEIDGESLMDGFTRICNLDLIPEETEILIIQGGLEDCNPFNSLIDKPQVQRFKTLYGDNVPETFFLFDQTNILTGLERMTFHLETRIPEARVYVVPIIKVYGKALRLAGMINEELLQWAENCDYHMVDGIDEQTGEDYLEDIFTGEPNELWVSIVSDFIGKIEAENS